MINLNMGHKEQPRSDIQNMW